MRESDLYPVIVSHLRKVKNCYPEYTGTEFYFGRDRGIRIDVFGIATDEDGEISLFFCEGKSYLNLDASFTASQIFSFPDYGDFLYFFGKGEQISDVHLKIVEFCRNRGVGIFLIDGNDQVREVLNAERHDMDGIIKRELLLRAFFRSAAKPVADLIFQALYESTIQYPSVRDNGIPFIEVYDDLFKDPVMKSLVNEITGTHTLGPRDMRKQFQAQYGRSDLVEVKRRNDILDDLLYN